VRIGDHALILQPLAEAGLLGALPDGVLAGPVLNPFLALGREAWSATRTALTELLREDAPERDVAAAALVPLAGVEARLPVAIGDYVDFYSSIEHASNVGRIFRPDAEPLLPNWRHLPVGYHGRASSVVVSPSAFPRPKGQLPPAETGGPPRFGPTERLDIELELGFVTGPGNPLGTSIPASAIREHVFGFVLVNDWSARDIQRWEYVPLGPFLGKSFATSISPWVVPMAALEPFRTAPATPPDAAPLEYLREEPWAFDIALEIEINGHRVAATNARELSWSAAQQLAHLTVNGAHVRTGDLIGSGTVSGATRVERGSLLELSWNGAEPFALGDGSERTFLEDGDEVVLRGVAGTGDDAVALGEVRGRIVGA
jgi:fumarylacetoacetase